jgi:preprotein translocase subunit YajC
MSFHFDHSAGAYALLAATKTTTSNKGSLNFFIFLILIVGVYFFYLRPRRARMLARQAAANPAAAPTEITAGDTVLTTSGIIGRVLSIDGDRASVEVAPDTVVEFHRTALGRRLDLPGPHEEDRWASLIEENAPETKWSSTTSPSDASDTEDTPTDDGTETDGDEEHPGGTS